MKVYAPEQMKSFLEKGTEIKGANIYVLFGCGASGKDTIAVFYFRSPDAQMFFVPMFFWESIISLIKMYFKGLFFNFEQRKKDND